MENLNDKISKLLVNAYKRIKLIYIGTLTYFIILILFDLIVNRRGLQEMIITYLSGIFIGILTWFGVRLVVWVQIKNKLCTERILDIFIIVVIIFFMLGSLSLGITYFIGEFTVSAFIAPIIVVSLVKMQAFRK